VIRRMLVLGGLLLPCTAPVSAADPVGAIAPAHGAILMIYVSQPLLSGSSRVYGLRLNQIAQVPAIAPVPTAGNDFYAASPQRSLVDLQIRRQADVRVEFGDRVTWNVRRREFEFPNAHPSKPIDFVANAH
jgi:hypothetical protein